MKLGAGSVLEPGAFLAGPAIIGKDRLASMLAQPKP